MTDVQCVSKTTPMLHTITSSDFVILAEILLREYAIKRWSVIPALLVNVSALPGETWTTEIVSYSRPISFWR